jgi:hypothetical protein
VKLFEEGNFSGWLRITLYVAGLATFFSALTSDWAPRWTRMIGFLLGFSLMALGGLSSRAHMLNVKPFDNSYKKARESYQTKLEQQRKSKNESSKSGRDNG